MLLSLFFFLFSFSFFLFFFLFFFLRILLSSSQLFDLLLSSSQTLLSQSFSMAADSASRCCPVSREEIVVTDLGCVCSYFLNWVTRRNGLIYGTKKKKREKKKKKKKEGTTGVTEARGQRERQTETDRQAERQSYLLNWVTRRNELICDLKRGGERGGAKEQ